MEYGRIAGMLRERRRVQTHIWGAERAARRSVGPGDAVARVNRLLLLDELRLYRKNGRFPLNHGWHRRPGESSLVYRDHDLTIDGSNVLCMSTPAASQYPVSIETAVAALRAGEEACVAILAETTAGGGGCRTTRATMPARTLRGAMPAQRI